MTSPVTAYSQLSENSLAQGRLSPYSTDRPCCEQYCCTDSNGTIWLSIDGQCRQLQRTSRKENLALSSTKRAAKPSDSLTTLAHVLHETNNNSESPSQTTTGISSLASSQCVPSSSGHQLNSVTVFKKRCISTQNENKESDDSPYRAEVEPDSV